MIETELRNLLRFVYYQRLPLGDKVCDHFPIEWQQKIVAAIEHEEIRTVMRSISRGISRGDLVLVDEYYAVVLSSAAGTIGVSCFLSNGLTSYIPLESITQLCLKAGNYGGSPANFAEILRSTEPRCVGDL